MFERYLFSQFACTTVYRNSFRNTVCTASLISRRRAVFPVPTEPQRPVWWRHRKSEWLHFVFIFLQYWKVVLWRVLFWLFFFPLLNSSLSNDFLVALLSLKANCPTLPCLPGMWLYSWCLRGGGSSLLITSMIYYAQFLHPLHFCSLIVNTDDWMVQKYLWMVADTSSHFLWEVFKYQ